MLCHPSHPYLAIQFDQSLKPLPCDESNVSQLSVQRSQRQASSTVSHTNRGLACISAESLQSKCIKVTWARLDGLLTAEETAFEM